LEIPATIKTKLQGLFIIRDKNIPVISSNFSKQNGQPQHNHDQITSGLFIPLLGSHAALTVLFSALGYNMLWQTTAF